MPSIGNEVRKRVVEDLRRVSRKYGDAPITYWEEAVMHELAVCLFPHGFPPGHVMGRVDELFDMLADVIERPTCRMVFEKDMSGDELYPTEEYHCSECGERIYTGLSNYCPGCGARVTTKYSDGSEWVYLNELLDGKVGFKEEE